MPRLSGAFCAKNGSIIGDDANTLMSYQRPCLLGSAPMKCQIPFPASRSKVQCFDRELLKPSGDRRGCRASFVARSKSLKSMAVDRKRVVEGKNGAVRVKN